MPIISFWHNQVLDGVSLNKADSFWAEVLGKSNSSQGQQGHEALHWVQRRTEEWAFKVLIGSTSHWVWQEQFIQYCLGTYFDFLFSVLKFFCSPYLFLFSLRVFFIFSSSEFYSLHICHFFLLSSFLIFPLFLPNQPWHRNAIYLALFIG